MELDRSLTGRRNLLLASLPAKDFALLAPQLKDIVLEQGAVLQEQGERIDQVYFPHDGIVSLLAVMRQGDAIETATIYLMDWLISEYGFTPIDAYCLVSTCPDFRINVYQMCKLGKLNYVAGAELPKRYFVT